MKRCLTTEDLMSEQQNIELVQRMISAVGQGDMRTVMETLDDNIVFQSPVTRTEHKGITWSRPRHGPRELMEFFNELHVNAAVEQFEDLTFTAQGDRVIIEGRNRGTARATGKTYEHTWVMVFVVRNGKISEHRHYYDTADIEPAFY
jgi:uncharacterized protein